MKKILVVLFLVVFISGCTIVRIDTSSINNIIHVVLSKDNNLYNHIGKGYRYYVPRGVTYIDTDEFNEKLYSNGTYYYLYVDAIGYYHDKEISYKEDKDAYYSKKIKNNGKEGYIEINKIGPDSYHLSFTYNYAKIEAVAPKKEINNIVLNSSYILSTVKFNHKIIKLMLNKDYFTNKEEKYDTFTTKEQSNYFLEYVDDKEK